MQTNGGSGVAFDFETSLLSRTITTPEVRDNEKQPQRFPAGRAKTTIIFYLLDYQVVQTL